MQKVLASQYPNMRTNGKIKWSDEIDIEGLMYLPKSLETLSYTE